MTTATATRMPQALIDQRRATRRRLRMWARLRNEARARWVAALDAIDNDATEAAKEAATLAFLRAGRIANFAQDRVEKAITNDNAAEAAQFAALRGR